MRQKGVELLSLRKEAKPFSALANEERLVISRQRKRGWTPAPYKDEFAASI